MKIIFEYRTKARIAELIRNLREMNQAIRDSVPLVPLHEIGWVSPISFLPLVVYANHNNLYIDSYEQDINICSYLESICFPEGTTRLSNVPKDFLPITRLSCTGGSNALTRYEDRIIEKVPEEFQSPFLNSLKYLTSELESNVREHAQVRDYWIFSQYWNRTRTCEIGICDTGIGYKASYQGTQYEVENHIDAIINALKGKSSKKPQERGAGIPSIVSMFVKGYKGEMMILSGDCLLYLNQMQNIAYKIGMLWQGSFVGLRFRLKGINIYNYL